MSTLHPDGKNKVQKSSSQVDLNPYYLADVAMLCHLLTLEARPQPLKETSHFFLAIFSCFSYKEAKIRRERSGSVPYPAVNSLHKIVFKLFTLAVAWLLICNRETVYY